MEAGNQHWGHATSKDLYDWENQPIALYPTLPNQLVYSGAAVVDPDNTSGFFPNQKDGVVAVYTIAQFVPEPRPQTQNVAYSTDGGYTFTPYKNNPVVPSTSIAFRDPQVIRYGKSWVMVVAYSTDFAVGIFTSPNLIDWTPTSNVTFAGVIGLQYECPNLVRIPVEDSDEEMWLLYLSINPGAPLGGSTGQYFPGKFNGTHFTPVDDATRLADFGKDNYATQFFYGTKPGEAPVSIAWASNWQYTNQVPTGPQEGFRGAMTLPRRNFLKKIPRTGWTLVSEPYKINGLFGPKLASDSSLGNDSATVDFSDVSSNAIYFEVKVTGIPLATGPVNPESSLNFTFSAPGSREELRGGVFFRTLHIWLDRGGVQGFDNPFFTDKFSLTVVREDNLVISGVVDRSVFEVFINGGEQSATNTFFPNEPLRQMTIEAKLLPPGLDISFNAYALKSTMA